MKKRTGIYKIKNIITEKVYVGSAIDIDNRWRKHKQMINEGDHHSIKLQNSVNKHGIDQFVFEIVEECKKELLIEREQYWIDKLELEFSISCRRRPASTPSGHGENPSLGLGRNGSMFHGPAGILSINRPWVDTESMQVQDRIP